MDIVTNKFWRLAPVDGIDALAIGDNSVLATRAGLVAKLSRRDGIIVASWDAELLQGRIHALGIVRDVDTVRSAAVVDWRPVELVLTPSPQGRSKWRDMPFFKFAASVAERYRLRDHFHDAFVGDDCAATKAPRPSPAGAASPKVAALPANAPAIDPSGEGAPASNGTLTVATWNTGWATLRSQNGRRVAARLKATGADIIVVTEGARELLPPGGHLVDAGTNWGYRLSNPVRRKVIVWSRFPLLIEAAGGPDATSGRLAVASTTTPEGPVRVIGVCIPWKDAHVTTGRCTATPWSEHLEYLDQLEALLFNLNGEVPTIIAGDFNQRMPRVRQPIRVADRLAAVLKGWTVHTAGDHKHGPHIDHVATNAGFLCESVIDWAASDVEGTLSDHSGVSCRLVRTAPPQSARSAQSAAKRGL